MRRTRPKWMWRLACHLLSISLLCTAGSHFALAQSTRPISLKQQLEAVLQAEDHRKAKAPALQQAVGSSSPVLRSRAALAFGRIQQPTCVPPLLKLLKDPVPQVRQQAAFALGQLAWNPAFTGKHKKQILQALQKALKDPSQSVQLATMEALGKYGHASTPKWMLPFLKGKTASLQRQAVMALFWFQIRQRRQARKKKKKAPLLEKSAFAHLLKLSKSKHHRVQEAVAYYFARLKDKRSAPIILQVLGSQHRWAKLFALIALRKNPTDKGLQAALQATKHKQIFIRVAAIQAIHAMKKAKALPLSLGKDPSFQVRLAFLRAYSSLPSVTTAQLQKWDKDPSLTVQRVLLSALAKKMKDKSLSRLNKALAHRHWLIRQAAVLASRGLKKGKLAFLVKAYQDKDVRVRSYVLRMLARNPSPKAFALIQKALGSQALSERGSAVDILFKRKEKQVLSLAWSTYLASSSKKWVEVREYIVDLIAKTPGKRTDDYLRKILKDPAPSVAGKARAKLLSRGFKKLPSIPAPKLTFSPHRSLRWTKNPTVILETNRGKMYLTCFAKAAPIHVANFVGLVQKGFYNGLLWHRVISNFVIQGGDPDGTGWGDGGFSVRAEINQKRYTRGTLGMPRSQGWNTGSVQLFISHIPTPHLDGRYTVFGQVTKGLNVLDNIEVGDRILRAYVLSPTTSSTKPTSRKAPTSK